MNDILACDVLVIGTGISGLSYALKIVEKLPNTQIVLVSKEDESETNTKYAQGGLAVVTNLQKDSFEKHVQDTLKAGDGLCDESVVRMVVSEGPERLKEIIEWGVNFDEKEPGKFRLGIEGGHTEKRILHHKDMTGYEIERALLAAVKRYPNITILPHHYLIDLITEHHFPADEADLPKINKTCFGAYILDKNQQKIKKFTAKITLLATGGAGHVYKNTTNPLIATGDGIGVAYRAKVKIENMQFFQFHPTAYYSKREGLLFLISEAVRGFGAKLLTKKGQKFMHKYDPREELASRDIVARAIDSEMKINGDDYVCIDCRHLPQEEFKAQFPNIYNHCINEGIDPFKDLIPVVPAAHYLCGGIKVDKKGRSSLKNLYAVGECSCTGLHGANRLASNSLLEALVYAHNAAIDTIEELKSDKFSYELFRKIPEWDATDMKMMDEMVIITYLRKELQHLMSDLVGIVRSNKRLRIAAEKCNEIFEAVDELYRFSIISPQLSELRNLVSVAHLIIQQSLEQKENRGTFFNKDLK